LIEFHDVLPNFEDYSKNFFDLLNAHLLAWDDLKFNDGTLSMFMLYNKNLFENINLNLKQDGKNLLI
jgi:hypothetical protein